MMKKLALVLVLAVSASSFAMENLGQYETHEQEQARLRAERATGTPQAQATRQQRAERAAAQNTGMFGLGFLKGLFGSEAQVVANMQELTAGRDAGSRALKRLAYNMDGDFASARTSTDTSRVYDNMNADIAIVETKGTDAQKAVLPGLKAKLESYKNGTMVRVAAPAAAQTASVRPAPVVRGGCAGGSCAKPAPKRTTTSAKPAASKPAPRTGGCKGGSCKR